MKNILHPIRAGCLLSGYSQIYCYLLSKSRTKNYGCLPRKSARSVSSATALRMSLTSLGSLVRMMNSRQGCNQITPVSALSSQLATIMWSKILFIAAINIFLPLQDGHEYVPALFYEAEKIKFFTLSIPPTIVGQQLIYPRRNYREQSHKYQTGKI